MFEQLVVIGWVAGRLSKQPHMPGDAEARGKVICVKGLLVRRPLYLARVLRLPEPFAVILRELHCQGHNMYYDTALALIPMNIHDLVPRQRVGCYKQSVVLNLHGDIRTLTIPRKGQPGRCQIAEICKSDDILRLNAPTRWRAMENRFRPTHKTRSNASDCANPPGLFPGQGQGSGSGGSSSHRQGRALRVCVHLCAKCVQSPLSAPHKPHVPS